MHSSEFPPNTAGSRLVSAIPKAKLGDEIAVVEQMLTQRAEDFDTIDYVYVVDQDNVLKGVISIREIHISKKDAHVEEIMTKKLVFSNPLTDQERIVYLALSNGIKSIPIVDEQMRLLGIVPYNEILNVFNEEVREDTFRFGGIFHRVGNEYMTIKASAATMIRTRIPWLIVGVMGGIVTASIVGSFEHVLSTLLTLAAFTPVLAYLSDAVGTQSETLAVRSIALDPKLRLKAYFKREFLVAIVLALVCGGLLATFALIGWQDLVLSLIVGTSMFLSIIVAVLISTGFPFVFKKANMDPAIASGPFATMVSDIATITIYFALASLLMVQFGIL